MDQNFQNIIYIYINNTNLKLLRIRRQAYNLKTTNRHNFKLAETAGWYFQQKAEFTISSLILDTQVPS